MDLRETRQRDFAKDWLKSKFGILLISPRMGKCRCAIYALQELNNPSVLIAYPDGKIKQSWIDEFELMRYDSSRVVYTTYLSLHKHEKEIYDVVILDEVHLMSENQLLAAYELLKTNRVVMGLTGTLTSIVKNTLYSVLGLSVIAVYSIEQAVDENVITDYQVDVITTPLDKIVKLYNGKTEKQKFDSLSWTIDKFVREGRDAFFLRLQRMRIIQNSVAKKRLTIKLLEKFKDERVLVFCGLTKVADSLGISSYHSKSSEKNIFEDFVDGNINHMAVVKIGNTGITYQNLNRVIINYTDSNPANLTQKLMRCTSMEYNNPDKKALITIVSTNEDVELSWIRKGTKFFDLSKIKYV